MIFIEGIQLLLLYSVFIYFSYKKLGTLFNPMAYYYANEILRGALFLLIYPFDESVFFSYVMSQVDDIDIAFFKYFIFQLIYSSILFVTFFIGISKGKTLPIKFELPHDYRKQKKAAIWLISLGIILGIQYFSSTGGLISYLDNMNQRTTLSSGTLFFRYYWILLISGLAMYYLSQKEKRKAFRFNISLLAATLFVFAGIVIFGARSPVFFSIIFLMIIYKLLIKNNSELTGLNLKSIFRSSIILSICFVLFFLLVALREPDAFNLLRMNGLDSFLQEILIASYNKSIAYLNSVTKYIYLYGSGKFGYGQELWYGSSFIDLVYALIPRILFEDKPPVEEGVYIYSIINGLDVRPSTPADQMYSVAWPIDTIGVMYVNFGFMGIIPGAIIMGIIQALFFNSVKKSPNVFLIMIWVFQIFPFSLTNSGIFNLTIVFAFMWLIFTIFCSMKTKIYKSSTQY